MKKSTLRHRRRDAHVCALICALSPIGLEQALAAGTIPADTAGFDLRILRQRNISEDIARALSEGPRFTPGQHRVSVSLNGRAAGMATITVDANGTVCASQETYRMLGLAASPIQGDRARDASCIPVHSAAPGAQVALEPATNALALVVAQSLLITQDLPHQQGGVAAVANYNAFAVHTTHRSGSSSHYASVLTSIGFNAGGWVVRSGHTGSWQDGTSRHARQSASARRALPRYGLALDIGEFGMANPLFAGTMMLGAQVQPDSPHASGQGGPAIEGIARTQARVEVIQHGRLLYSAMVDPGPFSLGGVQVDRSAGVELVVYEQDGSVHRSDVPASALGNAIVDSNAGLFAAVGRTTGYGDAPDTWMASAGVQHPLDRATSLAAGGIAAEDYAAVGLGMGHTHAQGGSLSARQVFSRSTRGARAAGMQSGLWWSTSLPTGASMSLGTLWQSPGYRDVGESAFAAPDVRARTRQQTSLSLGWTAGATGTWRLGLHHSRRHAGTERTDVTASWSRRFGRSHLSANVGRGREGGIAGSGLEARMTLSVPLGPTTLRTAVRDDGRQRRLTASLGGSLGTDGAWSAAAEHDRHGTALSSRLSGPTVLGQGSLGYSHHPNSRSWNGGLTGGLVIDRGGLVHSMQPVAESFAVIEIDEMPGVRLRTPGGTITTNGQGRAVAPSLLAWRSSTIEVITRSLPREVTLDNGLRRILAGRGAVVDVHFRARRASNLLLRVIGPDGAPIALGSGLFLQADKDEQYVTTFVQGGLAYLEGFDPRARLIVRHGNGKRCTVLSDSAERSVTRAGLQHIAARCDDDAKPPDSVLH